jgi:AmmeMemoRadiSam system protein A
VSERGPALLAIARGALEASFGAAPVEQAEAWPLEHRAVFVTLTSHGQLRGCVGQAEARYPLGEAVREAARAAAFSDPRFAPLEKGELAEVRIEVSVLSPMQWLDVHSEGEALERICPGVDGVVLQSGLHRGLFLPVMWKKVPDPKEFLFLLRRKAGLPTDRWLPQTEVGCFTAEVFEEPEERKRS